MKTLLACFSLVLLLSACNKPQESMYSRLRKADKVEIKYYEAGNLATNPLILLAVEQIDGISSLVTDTVTEALKCGYDGKITFTKKDSLIFEGEFNLEADCGHIAYTLDGKTQFRKLSRASIAFLTSQFTSNQKSKLDELSWFLGNWTQVEGPDLVSFEEWKRVSPSMFKGLSYTLYQKDTVHVETIDLALEGNDIYYIPTVPENKGPVRFKMTTVSADSVAFENPEHDFPQKITYEAKGDSMLLAKISGSKNGVAATKAFPLKRVEQ